MKKLFKNPGRLFLLGATLLLISVILTSLMGSPQEEKNSWPYNQTHAEEISLSKVFDYVDLVNFEEDSNTRVGVLGDYFYVDLGDRTVKAKVPFPSTTVISDLLKFSSADITIYEATTYQVSLMDRILQFLPLIVILAIFLIFAARGATRSLGLTSAFEVVEAKDLREGFSDVAGIENAKGDLKEIVDFLRDPQKISALGGRMPRGALFAGHPGTGKTLLARALAKEAGVSYLRIDASSVNQIFVGAGSMKIRNAFKAARKLGKCIIFIDEIDAMGRARGGNGASGSDEKETTLNTLLIEMDGFEARDGIFIIAATNRPDILDPALVRAGRFDRRVDMTLPDISGRRDILSVHLSKIKTSPDLDLEALARSTYGMSGADLALIANEAAIIAARRGSTQVEAADLIIARDRKIVGQSSSNIILNEAERRVIAVHEAGHAFIAQIRDHADPIEKATIVPAGGALGYVMQMPERDNFLESKARLLARLDVAVAGRVAEELLLGPDAITTGAASDIAAATRIARNMVQYWGMSHKGFVALGDSLDPLHNGAVSTSEAVLAIIADALERVRADMMPRVSVVQAIASSLVADETISGDQIALIVSQVNT